jgi:hypothetical protein
MATQEQMDALLARMRGMSAADLSVLDASAHTPDSNMTTSPGSPNQALWSEMVKIGWMNEKEDAIGLPGGTRFTMTVYSIRPEGLEPILSLLSHLSKS